MIIAEFSVIPIGTGSAGVSKYVKAALSELEKEDGIRVTSGAMGTVIEAENLSDIFGAVKRAHTAIFKQGVERVVTELKIDDRRDKDASAESKIRALG